MADGRIPFRFLSGLRWFFQLLLVAAFSFPAPAATPPPLTQRNELNDLFELGLIPVVRIQISEAGIEHLRQDRKAYVKATLIEGSRVYTNVAIHLKGAAGSFRPIDGERPALTLNFDKFQDGQRFHGLDKFHLNNSVQDGSYLTELLCSDLFLAAGVPAARVGHAIVELNGRKLGLYVLKEGFGKSFLKRHFATPRGNLYDGGFLKDINEPLERISGVEAAGQPEVKALVEACEIANPVQRMAALEKRLDVDRFLSFIALEMMTWHWDGYLMKKNNYRVYHDPDSDRIVFMPHGMDQMFWEPRGSIFPQPEGMVASAFLSTPAGKARFRARAAMLTTNVFLVDRMTNRICEVRSRVRPLLAEHDPDQLAQYDAEVRKVARQVEQRGAFLLRMLAGAEAKPLVFNSQHEAPVRGWKSRLDAGNAQFRQLEQNGHKLLIIEAVEPGEKPAEESLANCLASYRAVVILTPGSYKLVGSVRSEGIVGGGKSVRGSGAGLRISLRKLQNSQTGDSDWQELSHAFTVGEEQEEVELICDLRARKGRALFDEGSLRIQRVEDGSR